MRLRYARERPAVPIAHRHRDSRAVKSSAERGEVAVEPDRLPWPYSGRVDQHVEPHRLRPGDAGDGVGLRSRMGLG